MKDLLERIDNCTYSQEEYEMIYKNFEDDNLEVCSKCRCKAELIVKDFGDGDYYTPNHQENVTECCEDDLDKATFEEWLYLNL